MTTATLPQCCPACSGSLCIERLRCRNCGTSVEGGFPVPRLARLTKEDQQFLELFVVSSGSLKSIAKTLGVSYPTVRKQLNGLITALKKEIENDDILRKKIVAAAEKGEISVQQAKTDLNKI